MSRWGWPLRLILANVVAFVLMGTLPPELVNRMVLIPSEALVAPWTFVTYMFLHGGLGHIFFNMLALFFFGPRLEGRLGGGAFLGLYFTSGIMGGLLSLLLAPHAAIIGASGAVFGVMLAYAWFWPRDQILIWGIIPIEARYLVLLMTAVALWSGFSGSGGNVAHFAHLGGFLGGYLFLRILAARHPGARFQRLSRPPAPRFETINGALERWKKIRRDQLHEVNRDELDRILDKISAQGIGSLTAGEREFLDRFSARH
ncbi:MAG TPA: rhomboid family intramembrane serine protease [Gemmatimonadales bacterium]|nr:rhomboid family intramembrane serine protease [Gemmatimonadales bacterium]